jgi:5-methylcytosine-specific restriction endonuclease McrA|tara:strand:+ start:1475 stop:1849 length:375 start_codon:yes stop_codon:yes gene_type:complete
MTILYNSPSAYVFNLQTTSNSEAKRLWRRDIKEKWDWECAYCGSEHKLTIDHIVPRAKGGTDFTKNCLCACHSCNQDKSHSPWEEWYRNQEFFSQEKYDKIKNWVKPEAPTHLHTYRQRRNNAS